MYRVVVDKKFVLSDVLAQLETESFHLLPWNPMGALAAGGI